MGDRKTRIFIANPLKPPSRPTGLALLLGLLLVSSTAVSAQQSRLYTWGRAPHQQFQGRQIPQDPLTASIAAGVDFGGPGISTQSVVNISGIAAGKSFTVAWSTETNELFTWGYNENGVLCLNNQISSTDVPQAVLMPEGETIIKAVAASRTFAILTSTGNVYTCGAGALGQLGNGYNSDSPGFVRAVFSVGDDLVTDIVASTDTFLAETSTGAFYSWGSNSNGLLGIEAEPSVIQQSNTPIRITSVNDTNSDAVLGSGKYHFLIALPAANQIYTWGFAKPFQILAGHTSGSGLPVYLVAPTRVNALETALAAQLTTFGAACTGIAHGAMLSATGAQLFTWGTFGPRSGRVYGLTDVVNNSRVANELAGNSTTFTALSCSGDYAIALTAAGTVYGWGSNSQLQLGNRPQPLVIVRGVGEFYSAAFVDMPMQLETVAPYAVHTDPANKAVAIAASDTFAQIVVKTV